MYLKSLTLRGFKSFADKTQMTFDPGLNVVVGPNGSGKSNVSDSLLWVLGEQSAKMLRGQAMEDVIFSGSSARQPVSMAEVTIVLDNSDRTLPIDFEEVGITRRMYRSGESEYLINGAPARLMDIQDILHDSGMGKDTHSIISQGKLDSVLASRPEDRRELIEEAAGISKHRRRKERSERKLKSMEQSLTRAKDVQREITRQLRPLERQVTKARRSHELQDRLSELTTTLAVDDLRQLQAQYDRLAARGKEADAARDLARYQLDQRNGELERLQSLLEQKGLFVGDLDEQRRRTQTLLSQLDSDLRLLQTKGRSMDARLGELDASRQTAARQRSDAARELEEATTELAEARGQVDALQQSVHELQPQAKEAAERRRQLNNRQAKLTNDQRSAQRESDQETLAYAKLRDRISNAEVEDQMYQSRLDAIAESQGTYEETLAERRGRKAELDEALAQAQKASDAASDRIREGQPAVSRARQDLDDARKRLSQARAQLSALRSVDASQDSASPLVAALGRRASVKDAVECRLGDLIEVPAELDSLVERLLGDDLGALVVEGPTALAQVADEALGMRSAKGRATLVARQGMPAPAAPATDAPGEALLDRVHAAQGAEGAQGLLQALLGDVRIVEDVQAAVRAHEQAPAYTYVTTQGVTVLPDGRLVVGTSGSAEQGSLERKRRMRALEEGMPALEQEQEAAEKALHGAEAALSKARDELSRAKADLSSTRAELNSVSGEVSRLEAQQRQATAEAAQVTKKREEARAKAAKARAEVEEHHRRADEAAERARRLGQELDDVATQRSEASRDQTEAERKLSDAKLQLATVQERRRHLEVRVGELTRSVRDLERQAAFDEAGTTSLRSLRQRVEPLQARLSALHEAAQDWYARLQDRASLAEADSDELKKTIGDAKKSSADASAALERAQSEVSDIKVQTGRLEVQVDNAIQAITATGAILEEALDLPEPDDREAMEREVADLKAKLAKIGPVNEVAMEQYTELKQRADYIDEQVRDLEGARSSLAKITAAIDRKMRNRFLTVFDQVNANFQDIFGMLFPGGQAHIEMTDPDHPSETGIEVVAQPQGKRITKMTLMSGGEKSLTALALLFAVYKTRTVPFYVFDEVEAALDESNLGRLLSAIEVLKESTQLIVITHQRRTMEQADVLYGVSMQADGVSHVVSQRLDRATGKVVDA